MHLEKPLWPLVFHKWIIDGCLVSMCWYICFSVFRFMCHYSCLFVCLLVITVNRPLDYEQVPGGLIFLTLMARDGGNLSLNSTVPVTIELFVSTTPSFQRQCSIYCTMKECNPTGWWLKENIMQMYVISCQLHYRSNVWGQYVFFFFFF